MHVYVRMCMCAVIHVCIHEDIIEPQLTRLQRAFKAQVFTQSPNAQDAFRMHICIYVRVRVCVYVYVHVSMCILTKINSATCSEACNKYHSTNDVNI